MKAILVLINFLLSFAALSIDTERSPIWAVLLVVAWFVISTLLIRYAFRKGWLGRDDYPKSTKEDVEAWEAYYRSFKEAEKRENDRRDGRENPDNNSENLNLFNNEFTDKTSVSSQALTLFCNPNTMSIEFSKAFGIEKFKYLVEIYWSFYRVKFFQGTIIHCVEKLQRYVVVVISEIFSTQKKRL